MTPKHGGTSGGIRGRQRWPRVEELWLSQPRSWGSNYPNFILPLLSSLLAESTFG